MPQLIPFYFVNQFSFSFLTLLALIYLFSKTDNSNISHNSVILGLLTSFKNKMPNWLKLILKILLVCFLIIRIFGIHTILDVYINQFKLVNVVLCSLYIMYEVYRVCMLFLFSSGKIEISDLLPKFIQNWLNTYKEICANRDSLKEELKSTYISIGLYTILLILFIIIV